MIVQRLSSSTLQKALYLRLTTILSVPVFDYVPDGQVMPYVVIGNDTNVKFNTKTSKGTETTLIIHIWSDYEGNKEAQDLLNIISSSLTTTKLDLSVDSFKVIEQSLDFVQILKEPDGEARQGVLRFRYLIEDII